MTVKDATATFGTVLPADVGGRDAVHVAVIAVRAGTVITGGAHLALREVEPGEYLAIYGDDPIGVADPFIKELIKPGERFWFFLYPRTITALAHHWQHPSFPGAKPGEVYRPPADKVASEAWLREWCKKSDCPSYEEVIGLIIAQEDEPWDGNYILIRDRDAHAIIPDVFWDHVEVVLGRKIKNRAAHFTCTC